jgi:hypothetical protein
MMNDQPYVLYYWFKGTPADRDAGPWWRREFGSEESRDQFLGLCSDCLYAFAQSYETKPFLDNRIKPPKGVTIFHTTSTEYGRE